MQFGTLVITEVNSRQVVRTDHLAIYNIYSGQPVINPPYYKSSISVVVVVPLDYTACMIPLKPLNQIDFIASDACPKDETTIASNKGNANCLPERTRFCFRNNCKR